MDPILIEMLSKMESAQTGMVTSVKEMQADAKLNKDTNAELQIKLEGYQAELKILKGQIGEVIVKHGRNFGAVGASGQPRLSSVLLKSEAYVTMTANGAREMQPVEVKGGFHNHVRGLRQKDLTAGGSPIVDADRVPGIVDVQFRPLTIRDLFPSFSTQSNSIEYVEETRFNQLSATSTSATAAGVSLTVDVNNINGFKVGSTVTFSPDAAPETAIITVVTAATADDASGTITFGIAIAALWPIGTQIVSDEFNFTAEALLKPNADIKLEVKNAAVKTLAHWIAASRQILMDDEQLRAHVDFRLLQGLGLEEERQILYGNNTSTELDGIISNANTQTYNIAAGPATDQAQDAVRRGMTLVALAHYPADGIIMHPTDWESIELAKDVNDRYIVTTQVSNGAETKLWRLPVVITTAIDAGTALVGAFALGAQLYDREQSSIRVSESHQNYFARNMVAILAEERMTMTLTRPESFCAVTL